MGRPKAFTNPEEFDDMVNAYFESISYKKNIYVSTFDLTDDDSVDGSPSKLQLKDDDGNPIRIREWIKPPLITGLCNYLGIHRDTWAEYAKNPQFSDTTTRAKAICEEYMLEQTAKREGSTNGLQFLLRAVYGYRDVQSIKVETTAKLEDEFE